MIQLIALCAAIGAMWYVLIVRPGKVQAAEHERFVSRIEIGDRIMTVGGIYGTVLAMHGSELQVELAEGMVVTVTSDAVARIVKAGTAQQGPDAGSGQEERVYDNNDQHGQYGQQPPAQPGYGDVHAQYAAPQPQHDPNLQYAPPQPQHEQNHQYAPPLYATPQHYQAPAPSYQPPPAYPAHAQAYAAPQPAPGPPPRFTVQLDPPQHTFRARVEPFAQPAPPPMQWREAPTQQFQQPALVAPQPTGAVPYHQMQRPAAQFAPGQQFAPGAPNYAQPPAHVQQYAQPQAYAQPGYPPQQEYAPQQAYAPQQGYVQPQYAQPPTAAPAPTPEPAVAEHLRRRSAPPPGFGATATMNDDLMREFERARQEREQLASEYRSNTDQIVRLDDAPPPPNADRMPVGPSGVALFASQQATAPNTQQASVQYPAAPQLPSLPADYQESPYRSDSGVPAPFTRPGAFTGHQPAPAAAPA